MTKVKLEYDGTEHESKIEEGETVRVLLKAKGYNPAEFLVSVNGTLKSKEYKPEDGDKIELLDIITGG